MALSIVMMAHIWLLFKFILVLLLIVTSESDRVQHVDILLDIPRDGVFMFTNFRAIGQLYWYLLPFRLHSLWSRWGSMIVHYAWEVWGGFVGFCWKFIVDRPFLLTTWGIGTIWNRLKSIECRLLNNITFFYIFQKAWLTWSKGFDRQVVVSFKLWRSQDFIVNMTWE